MVPKPGNWLEKQISWLYSRSIETETLGIEFSNVLLNKPSRWFLSTVNFENHSSRTLDLDPYLNIFLIQNSWHFVTPSSTFPGQCHLPFSHLPTFKCCILTPKSYLPWMGQSTQCLSLRVLKVLHNLDPYHVSTDDTQGHMLNFIVSWKYFSSEISKSKAPTLINILTISINNLIIFSIYFLNICSFFSKKKPKIYFIFSFFTYTITLL